MSNERLLCVDQDVLAMLAAAGRLSRSVELLGFDIKNVRRLPGIEHMLRKGRRFRQFTDLQKDLIIESAGKIEVFGESPVSVQTRQRLIVPGIDEGEGTLFAVIAERPMLWVSTGDLLSLRTLCSNPDLADVKQAIASRIVSLESVMFLLFENDGYEQTANAFSELRTHRTIRCLFPNDARGPENVMAAPISFLRSLCKELGRGFLHCPPCPGSAIGECKIDQNN